MSSPSVDIDAIRHLVCPVCPPYDPDQLLVGVVIGMIASIVLSLLDVVTRRYFYKAEEDKKTQE